MQLELLAPSQSAEVAEAALRAAVLEVQESAEAEEREWRSEWDVTRVAGRVLVSLQGDDHGREALGAVLASASARGIDGTLTLCEQAAQAPLPEWASMLACRLRVRGQRAATDVAYHWRPDAGAYAATLRAGLAWSSSLTAWLSAGWVGWLMTSGTSDAGDVLDRAVQEEDPAAYAGRVGDDIRCVGTWPQGGVSLVTAAARDADGGPFDWEPALEALVALLRDIAPHLTYAAVMSGVSAGAALRDGHLSSIDRVERPGGHPIGAGPTRWAFEDLYAEDAYAIQYLGPGYADRTIPPERWTTEPTGDGRLVIASDLSSWFGELDTNLMERAKTPRPAAVSPVLAQAREDLDPVLYVPGRLAAHGFCDETGTVAL